MRWMGVAAAIVGLLVATGASSAQPAGDPKGAQQTLRTRGFDPGPIDGVVGARTTKAIREFQKANGLTATGKLDVDTVAKLAEKPGPMVKGLVTSLGGFSATVDVPVTFTGATVEIAPGGQTGRQMFRVPTYVYVLEGILTTEYEAGPVGIKGAQYHGAGQSFMDNGGWWHNHANRTEQPVKYLMVHQGYPGLSAVVQKPEAE
jgi:hypothetical protein